MQRVTVIGGGTMGNGIAHVCAQGGLDVTLVDVDPAALERARATIRKNLERQVRKGLVADDAVDEILGRVSGAQDPAVGAEGADLVVEAVPEKAELKYSLFRTLDAAAPGSLHPGQRTPPPSPSPRSRPGPPGRRRSSGCTS